VPKFFSGFRRKRLFITTSIEKQCTRPLIFIFKHILIAISI